MNETKDKRVMNETKDKRVMNETKDKRVMNETKDKRVMNETKDDCEKVFAEKIDTESIIDDILRLLESSNIDPSSMGYVLNHVVDRLVKEFTSSIEEAKCVVNYNMIKLEEFKQSINEPLQ